MLRKKVYRMKTFSLFALALSIGAVPLATAQSVTLEEAVVELRAQDAVVDEAVLIYGEPVIWAQYEEQGYRLILTQCEGDDYACNITIFSACTRPGTLSREASIEFANAKNGEQSARGTYFVQKDASLGHAICIRLRRDLHKEDDFDIADVFQWHDLLRDFADDVEERKRDSLASDLIQSGLGAAPNLENDG